MSTRVNSLFFLGLRLFLLFSFIAPGQAYCPPWWKNPFKGKVPTGEIPPGLKKVPSGAIVPPLCKQPPKGKTFTHKFIPGIFDQASRALIERKDVTFVKDANGNWVKGALRDGEDGTEISFNNSLFDDQRQTGTVNALTIVQYKVRKGGQTTENQGTVERILDVENKELILESAFLQELAYNGTCVGQKIDNKMKIITNSGEVPSLAPDGNPTVLLITLAQVNAMMDKSGPINLKTIKGQHIQNLDALGQLVQLKKENCLKGTEDEVLSLLYPQTDAFRYIQTTATQMGYTVKGVRVETLHSFETPIVNLLSSRLRFLNPELRPADILEFFRRECLTKQQKEADPNPDYLDWDTQYKIANAPPPADAPPHFLQDAKNNLRLILELRKFKETILDPRELCAADMATPVTASFDVIVSVEKDLP